MSKVLIVDYDSGNIATLQSSIPTHIAVTSCYTRPEAITTLFEQAMRGDMPQMVVAHWWLEPPHRRSFYSTIGCEVERTSLNLLKNASRIPDIKTIICYADPVSIVQIHTELRHRSLQERVTVLNLAEVTLLTLGSYLGLQESERHKVLKRHETPITEACPLLSY